MKLKGKSGEIPARSRHRNRPICKVFSRKTASKYVHGISARDGKGTKIDL